MFEVSNYLGTKAGAELRDALVYLSEFVEVTVRNLRNGLTYVDNFDALRKQVTVREDRETAILVGSKRRVKEVQVRQVVDDEYYSLTSFGWRYTSSGDLVIKCKFDGTPPADRNITLVVLLHFG